MSLELVLLFWCILLTGVLFGWVFYWLEWKFKLERALKEAVERSSDTLHRLWALAEYLKVSYHTTQAKVEYRKFNQLQRELRGLGK